MTSHKKARKIEYWHRIVSGHKTLHQQKRGSVFSKQSHASLDLASAPTDLSCMSSVSGTMVAKQLKKQRAQYSKLQYSAAKCSTSVHPVPVYHGQKRRPPSALREITSAGNACHPEHTHSKPSRAADNPGSRKNKPGASQKPGQRRPVFVSYVPRELSPYVPGASGRYKVKPSYVNRSRQTSSRCSGYTSRSCSPAASPRHRKPITSSKVVATAQNVQHKNRRPARPDQLPSGGSAAQRQSIYIRKEVNPRVKDTHKAKAKKDGQQGVLGKWKTFYSKIMVILCFLFKCLVPVSGTAYSDDHCWLVFSQSPISLLLFLLFVHLILLEE